LKAVGSFIRTATFITYDIEPLAPHRTEHMTHELGGRKGRNWLKIIGIITLIGLVVAVARIVLRVFREKPEETPGDEVHGV
jgi:hypothetical protein